MPDHQPGAPEDPFHLVIVGRLIAEDAAIEFAGDGVDHGVFPSITHTQIPPRVRSWRRGRDSNPRDDSSPSTRSPGMRLRPLGHPSSVSQTSDANGRAQETGGQSMPNALLPFGG